MCKNTNSCTLGGAVTNPQRGLEAHAFVHRDRVKCSELNAFLEGTYGPDVTRVVLEWNKHWTWCMKRPSPALPHGGQILIIPNRVSQRDLRPSFPNFSQTLLRGRRPGMEPVLRKRALLRKRPGSLTSRSPLALGLTGRFATRLNVKRIIQNGGVHYGSVMRSCNEAL